ncbi:MAG: exo-alpha-sialidase [Acidobacteriia bacterium]|nr:exo-alpha-sialidase [Terriglobia bacterium]
MKKPLFTLLFASLCAFGQALAPQTTPNPAAAGSVQPQWSITPDGHAVLSWIEPVKSGGFALRYAVRGANGWSEARTVVANRHFFRHPAEVPEVIPMNDHLWMAHWVENVESSEAEFVYVSSSTDGIHWSAPVMVNKDKSQVEHGLVSMAASGNGEVSLFWLETPEGEDGPGYLMHSVVNAAGQPIKEERLESDVCNCCPTAVTRTAKGLLVAYRDRTKDDIRDISVLRFENGKWSQSKNVHADGWKLNACPTNAAAVASRGDRVALAWYTGAQNMPRVQMIFSTDGGVTFGKPVLVSTGHAYGYTSVALADDGTAYVSWLQQGPGNVAQVLARAVSAAGTAGPVAQLAEGGRMALGYPRVVSAGSETWIAWGDPKTSRVDSALLKH